ncbi:MAG: ABC transporter ATP-binding protein [Clostridiaceae bacterium]|nr:ABC transporter ATP-binding protein [Clostridiaceae bacterium]
MGAVVKVHNLSMKYHSINSEIAAVENINLSVEEGEFVSIVGPSGCGKSTLLSLIAGLLLPSEGQVIIEGKQVIGSSHQVGYMLQRDHLFEWRTILENVVLGLEITHTLNPETKGSVTRLLDTYGLADFKDKYPNQLSGGMRQRAALIRTLATDPKILLLDEAFSSLDYQTRLAVAEDIYMIIKRENKTAVLVTHDIAESISMADRVVVLTRRPGSIKSVYNIELSCDNRTPMNSREAPEFRHYFNQIWKDLDVHV